MCAGSPSPATKRNARRRPYCGMHQTLLMTAGDVGTNARPTPRAGCLPGCCCALVPSARVLYRGTFKAQRQSRPPAKMCEASHGGLSPSRPKQASRAIPSAARPVVCIHGPSARQPGLKSRLRIASRMKHGPRGLTKTPATSIW